MKSFSANISILSLFIIAFSSCSKNGEDDLIESINILRNGNFEDASLLDELWNASGEGYSSSNSTDFYEGKYALSLGAETCRSMVYNETLSVESGKMYELSFAIKMPGIATGCASEFLVSVKQGEADLLYFNISPETANIWNKQSYFFTTESDIPVTLEFIVGMNQLLLDDMQLKEVLEL